MRAPNAAKSIFVLKRKAFFLCSFTFVSLCSAACNNQCSGHGDCGGDANCHCYANWMGPDCSQRVCGYTKAYISTPVGDVNGDGNVDMFLNKAEDDGRYMTEAYNIEYGLGRGSLDGQKEFMPWDEGHFYAECGNVGICDRDTGICDCFPGYSGSSCQRGACPGRIDGESLRDTIVCSGHGRCVPAYESVSGDYKLWDETAATKCNCDPWYTGIDCSLRKCPIGIDPVGSTNHVHNRLQKISFPAFDIQLDAITAPWGDYRARVNGEVLFAISAVDVYGDEWTTSLNTFKYMTTCSDISGIDCSVRPWFDQSILDAYNGENIDAPDYTALYQSLLLADQVNLTLQALPTSFPKDDMYVWMDYPQQDFRYPSEEYSSDDTLYFMSPYTKFPDFTRSEEVECGATLPNDVNGITSAMEGLCIFVRSPYLTDEDELFTVRYVYRDGITDDTLGEPSNPTETYLGKLHVGTSSKLSRDEQTFETSIAEEGTGLVAPDMPFVTVEEVGHFRAWNTFEDGYPALIFEHPEVAECSNRGLCNQFTGECACWSGYHGRDCSQQETLLDQGIVML
jgi:hypothetical protein